MTYEFVSIRFLQRSFGSTYEVWASEIAVCMAGLAAGYALGGWLADRFMSWRVLGKALVIAGCTGLLTELLADWSGELLLQYEYAWWHPLFAAGVCSFLPLLALGTVMPQAVRLHVRSLESVGNATGWIAAISTTGSITGVLLTAMVFLPRFGVRETLYTLSASLIVYGGLMAGINRIRDKYAGR